MSRKGPRSVLIIEARFYEDIADELARGAIDELDAQRVAYERIAVPGSLEIALALSLALANGFVGRAGRHRGCIALGCVIRGETTHYDIVARGIRPPAFISSPCSTPCRSASASSPARAASRPGSGRASMGATRGATRREPASP